MGRQQRTNIWIDGTQAGATLKTLQGEYRKLNNEIRQLPRNSDEYKKKLAELKAAKSALDEHRNAVNGISKAYSDATSKLSGMIKEFGPAALGFAGVYKGIQAVGAGISQTIGEFVSFDKEMANLGVLVGTKTPEDLNKLRGMIVNLSNDTGKSAIDIAKAFGIVGGAMPELLSDTDGLNYVTDRIIKLAQAADMEIPEVAAAVTKSMNQFGAAAKDAGLYTDILTTSQAKGTATISQLADAIENGGSTAKALNISFEETNAILQGFAKGGTVGAEAGTQFAGVMAKLTKVQNKDFNPAYTNAVKVLDNLKKANLSYTDLLKLTDAEGAKWLSTILNQNDTVQKLNGNLADLGATQRAGDQAQDNVIDKWHRLTNTIENYILGGTNATRASNAMKDSLDFLLRNLDKIVWTAGKVIKTFILYKSVQLAVNAAQFVFSGGLKNLAKEFTTLSKNAETGGSKVGKFGGALKAVGWAAITELAVELGEELWHIASGAAQAEIQLNRMNKAKAAGENKSKKVNDDLQDEIDERMRLLDVEQRRRIAQMKTSGEKEDAINKEFAERKKRVVQDAEVYNQNYIEREQKKYDKVTEIMRKAEAAQKYISDAMDGKNSGEKVVATFKELDKLAAQLGITAQKGTWGLESIQRQVVGTAKAEQTRAKTAIDGYSKYRDELTKLSDELVTQQIETKSAILTEEDQKKALKEQEKAAKKAREEYAKLRDALHDLIEKVHELDADQNYQARLDQYQEGLNKELFMLQKTNEEKYAQEIKQAMALMTEKGEIGQEAARQYNALLLIQDRDYEEQALQIKKRYAEIAIENEQDLGKEENLKAIAREVSLQDALAEIKVARAKAAVDGASGPQEKAEARKQLLTALEEEDMLKTQHSIDALDDEFTRSVISKEELDKRTEELEQGHLDRVAAMNAQSNEEISKIAMQQFQNTLGLASQFVNVMGQKAENDYNKQKKKFEANQQAEQDALDNKLRNNLISQQEYDTEKAALDKKSQQEQAKMQNDYAVKKKAAARAQALIGAAQAIIQGYAELGPIGGSIAAFIVGEATAQQIEAIDDQDVEQFAEGGLANGDYSVRGRRDNRKYRARMLPGFRGGMTPANPSLALIGEKGPEYVVPNRLMQNQQVANMVGFIEAMRLNQYAEGGYAGGIPQQATGSDPELTRVLSELSGKLDNLGITIGGRKARDIADEIDRVKGTIA